MQLKRRDLNKLIEQLLNEGKGRMRNLLKKLGSKINLEPLRFRKNRRKKRIELYGGIDAVIEANIENEMKRRAQSGDKYYPLFSEKFFNALLDNPQQAVKDYKSMKSQYLKYPFDFDTDIINPKFKGKENFAVSTGYKEFTRSHRSGDARVDYEERFDVNLVKDPVNFAGFKDDDIYAVSFMEVHLDVVEGSSESENISIISQIKEGGDFFINFLGASLILCYSAALHKFLVDTEISIELRTGDKGERKNYTISFFDSPDSKGSWYWNGELVSVQECYKGLREEAGLSNDDVDYLLKFMSKSIESIVLTFEDADPEIQKILAIANALNDGNIDQEEFKKEIDKFSATRGETEQQNLEKNKKERERMSNLK